ncbi:MAG: hypothetical protein F4X82_00525 [Candidatus Spechtbacteria bacterium SB0662_bin_43]|uniref:Uncharacterized protein n=1 Tax=Candidatus Spechtbacteria bacterium SB0662_bin_43 TaxID=2604897 RepID=A0A845DL07_9BACT|nr:hypothetical protein [Candidatus Spechtbacteria bacterium SB0662_bin_43]
MVLAPAPNGLVLMSEKTEKHQLSPSLTPLAILTVRCGVSMKVLPIVKGVVIGIIYGGMQVSVPHHSGTVEQTIWSVATTRYVPPT